MLLDATTPNSETDTKNENQEPEPASAVQGKDAVASVTKQSDIQEIRKETRSAVLFVDDDEADLLEILHMLQQAVSTDDDVDTALAHALDHGLHVFGTSKA